MSRIMGGPNRSSALVLVGLLVLLPSPTDAAAPAASARGARSAVRISGVYFDGMLLGEPEPDSAIRLTNTDPKRPASVGGFALIEPEGRRASRSTGNAVDVGGAQDGDDVDDADDADPDDNTAARGKRRRGARSTGVGVSGGAAPERRIRIPEGAVIPPGGEIWIGASARGFEQVFGFKPDFEARATAVDVRDTEGSGFPQLPVDHGALLLVDGVGTPVDFVAYETTKEPYFPEDVFATFGWSGAPVRLKKTSFYGWRGQVLARDRDERGALLRDTDSAADWDGGFSRKLLGEEPTHRVELAGQSRFIARPLKGVRATVLATSAPDNNYQALIDAFDGARVSIKVRIYEMTNPKILEALMKARHRNVEVTLFLEGSPVGGIADQERWLVDRAARAGIAVWFLAVPKGSKLKPRYRFDHSKYVIIDDKKVIIGSENYGRTGVPVFNSYGNRGWMVHVENPQLTQQLLAVWRHDFRPGVMPDILSINASPTDAFGLPYRDAGFQPDETLQRGLYPTPATPVLVDDKMNLELVLSPDTSLNEGSALLGLIGRAQRTLYVEQNSIRRRWGRKEESSAPGAEQKDDADNTPNLALQAVVAAARRGVAVRVLLDGTWYNVQGDEDRDNDDTVNWLNELAAKEGLDIVAKIINLETTHLEKIHTKGVIVDDREVFVGSINWTENSFKGNREVGVIIGHPKVAGYYANLFRRDWSQSRIYTAEAAVRSEVRASCERTGPVSMRVARGDALVIVGEHHNVADNLVCAEVQLGLGKTAFVDRNALGTPTATAEEALHVIGREAIVTGLVAATNVSERRIQLRFADEKRPPFTAIIWRKKEGAFTKAGMPPATAFQGRELKLRGMVEQYRGAEIILNDPSQVEILR